MILLDYSQIAISVITNELREQKGLEIQTDLIRHMVINSIRANNKKFRGEYGELVICVDGRNYWRKEVFPFYKANRKETRDKSDIDWSALFDSLTEIKNELKVFFPYRVVDINRAEADDVIATLVKWSSDHDVVDNGIVRKANPTLILCGDHDFIQLQQYDHVVQYHPVKKEWIKPDQDLDYYKFVHAVKGDSGDGIPNILSVDNSLVDKIRQKPTLEAKLKEWFKDPEVNLPDDPVVRQRFERNKVLTDLSRIPADIETEIVNSFTQQETRDRSALLNYFSQYKMRNLLSHIGDF
jgi:5'-3' exonuclease